MDFFADSHRARIRLTNKQIKEISSMYRELSREIQKEAEQLSRRANISSILRRSYLDGLSKQINQELNNLAKQQVKLVKDNMTEMASAVVDNNTKFLNKVGIHIASAYSHIPSDVVNSIATGELYKDRWSLSKAIWKNTCKTQQDINSIVAKGIAGQKSTYEIAKDLEDYVNPVKRKSWEWSKVYPGTSRVVDYNSQRLARTMISHAYEDSIVRTTKDNPFVECYEWLTSAGDRVCEICQERESGFHGVVINGESMYGMYYADDLPLDHPNGMCTIAPYVPYSYEEIGERLGKWVNGDEDEAIDNFAESLGYTASTLKGKVSRN